MNTETTDAKDGKGWVLLDAATFVFDLRPYLTDSYRRLGYYIINIVFVYLPVVYFLVAWKGGAL